MTDALGSDPKDKGVSYFYIIALPLSSSQLTFNRFLREELTNIWLGNGRTVGKLHFDPFDNLLCQVTGKKNLILFDPHNNENLYEGTRTSPHNELCLGWRPCKIHGILNPKTANIRL